MSKRGLSIAALLIGGCVEYDLMEYDQVEVFHQSPPEEVDILLVVDNSCSMGPYQEQLGSNFERFVEYFIGANVNYHIGVVTTDIEDSSQSGRIQGQIIDSESSNPGQAFTNIVNVGTTGSGWELGLEAAYNALSEPLRSGANAGFLRDDASLSIIFVSDEEDSSPMPVNDYINTFLNIKGARQRDIFNASALAVTDLGDCDPLLTQGSTIGTRYIDVARQTNGIIGNLCDEDFAGIVTELSLNTSRLRNVYYLKDLPDPTSLEVHVSADGSNTDPIPCDAGIWSYQLVEDEVDGSTQPAIVFPVEHLPEPGSKISVRYFTGAGDPVDFCPADSSGEE